jgi:hypothetical protein
MVEVHIRHGNLPKVASSLQTILDLFGRAEFLAGLGFGTAAALVLLGPLRHLPGIWGVSYVVASAAAVQTSVGRRLGVYAALALLGLGGYLWERNPYWGAAGVGAGALILTTRGGVDATTWVPWALVGMVFWAGTTGRRIDTVVDPGWSGLVIWMTAFGIWITVPDTDLARILVGVGVPLAALSRLSPRPVGPSAFALFGLFCWVAAVGGLTRPASVIGGWLALGLVLLTAAIRGRLPAGQALVVHAGLVLVGTRVIGLWTDALPAVIGGAILMGLGTYVLIAISRTSTIIAREQHP